VAILSGSQIAQILIQLLTMVLLARLLQPTDYGLFALGMVPVGLATMLADFGLYTASIRSPTLTSHQRDLLFWINVTIGVVLMVSIIAAAPLIARLFDDARLQKLLFALAPLLLIGGLTTQHSVSLVREMRFKEIAAVQIASAATAMIIGVFCAASGAGYWALVVQALWAGTFTLVMIVSRARWVPKRPRRSAGIRPILRFGASLIASGLISYGAKNIDTIIIGGRFGPESLGLYNRAMQMVKTPFGQLQGPLYNVAVPVMARVADDNDKLLRVMRDGQVVLAYPILFAVSVISTQHHALISLVLGANWTSAANILAFLAIAVGLGAIDSIGGWLYVGRGSGRAMFWATLFFTTIDIAFMAIGSLHGAVGLAAGLAASRIVAWPLTLFIAGRTTCVSTWSLITAGGRILAIAVSAAGAAWLVGHSPLGRAAGDIGSLALASVASALVFAAAALIPSTRDDYGTIISHAQAIRG
jgi:PST family polysaccharide transporter